MSQPDQSPVLPIVMQIQSVRNAHGEWVRRVSFPHYPSCVVETEAVEDGIDDAFNRLLDHLERTGPADVAGGHGLRTDLGPMIELYRGMQNAES